MSGTRKNTCGVYVVGETIGTGPDGCTPIMTPYIKIGVANNPEHRIGALRTGNPRNLLMLHWKPFPTRKAALEAERRAHWELAEVRRGGEWFEVDVTIAVNCVEFVSNV